MEGLENLEEIYKKYHLSLKKLSLVILLREEEASEVVHEVFSEVIQRPLNLTSCEMKNYLFRSVRNRSFNKLRGRKRLLHFLEATAQWLFPEEEQEALRESGNTQHDQKIDFINCLKKIPLIYREVLILRLQDQLALSEISELLQIPEGTVKSRINSGMKMMRKFMEG